jgi:hypothetical protein
MAVLDGNCAVGCGPGTDYPSIHIFQCMLERTHAITNGVLEPVRFVLAYPTVFTIYFQKYPTFGTANSKFQTQNLKHFLQKFKSNLLVKIHYEQTKTNEKYFCN